MAPNNTEGQTEQQQQRGEQQQQQQGEANQQQQQQQDLPHAHRPIVAALTAVTRERDALHAQLACANALIGELLAQTRAYHRLADAARAELEQWTTWYAARHGRDNITVVNYLFAEKQQAARAASSPANAPTWIGGCWAAEPRFQPQLGDAERMFMRGEYQRSIATLDALLARRRVGEPRRGGASNKKGNKKGNNGRNSGGKGAGWGWGRYSGKASGGANDNNDDDAPVSDKVRVAATIFKSVVLRISDSLVPALAVAEGAVRLADACVELALLSKAQFHRGLALYALDRFADAKLCFSLAAGAWHHDDEISMWKRTADAHLASVAATDPARARVSEGFEAIPRGGSDDTAVIIRHTST